MKNKTLIFDLDSTLYYAGNQMEKLCYNKVMSFLIENMNVNKIQAMKLIKEFRKNYHYDSEAIAKEYPFDQSEFIEYVCDIPTDFISEDKELATILKQISNSKYIVTDSTQKHTKDVLEKIKINKDLFVYIYDAHDMDYIFKYNKVCFEKFLDKFNLCAQDCVIFEDSIKNLDMAKSCGMITVFVKPDKIEKPQYVDYMFSDIKTALKELFLL